MEPRDRRAHTVGPGRRVCATAGANVNKARRHRKERTTGGTGGTATGVGARPKMRRPADWQAARILGAEKRTTDIVADGVAGSTDERRGIGHRRGTPSEHGRSREGRTDHPGKEEPAWALEVGDGPELAGTSGRGLPAPETAYRGWETVRGAAAVPSRWSSLQEYDGSTDSGGLPESLSTCV